MRKRLLVMLVTIIPFGLTPISALAEGCGDYPLTQKQSDYLQTQNLEIAIPEGEVPLIQRCDVDGNNVVDNNDLFAIRAHRGQPSEPDDPMDWDGNGIIHGRDVGGCASSCTSNGCAVKDEVEEEGLEMAADMGQKDLPSTPAACYQVEDFDGDGVQDFLGIFEYVGNETRGNNWNLQTVILYEDDAGDTQVVAFPYTGQSSRDGSEIFQHLSIQPAGVVDLMPGRVTLTQPGVVSYRNNEPKTLYYFQGGRWNRAFYRIDD